MAEGPVEGDVMEALKRMADRRQSRWDEVFNKYSVAGSEDDDISVYDFLRESFTSTSYKATSQNAYEAEVIHKIEKTHGSVFYDILIQQEKMRMLFDYEGYHLVKKLAKKEVKRLQKHVKQADVELYGLLSMKLKPNVAEVVKSHLKNNFDKALVNQFKYRQDHQKFLHYNLLLQQYWDFLRGFLQDDDITTYAVRVIQDNFCNQEC